MLTTKSCGNYTVPLAWWSFPMRAKGLSGSRQVSWHGIRLYHLQVSEIDASVHKVMCVSDILEGGGRGKPMMEDRAVRRITWTSESVMGNRNI